MKLMDRDGGFCYKIKHQLFDFEKSYIADWLEGGGKDGRREGAGPIDGEKRLRM